MIQFNSFVCLSFKIHNPRLLTQFAQSYHTLARFRSYKNDERHNLLDSD